MENKKYPDTLRPVNMLPQLSIAILWMMQIFLTIDNTSFLLSFAWPIPYKDAFYEDFTLYYIFYSAVILLICILSLINPRLAAIPVPLIVIFEAYTLISPILYKALYYSSAHALRYAQTIFNVTNKTFYLHTLKSLIIIAIAIMIFTALISKSRKVTLILFAVVLLLAVITVVPLIIEMTSLVKAETLDGTQADKISKSVWVGITRILPYLPLFFIGFGSKERSAKQN